MPHRSTLYHRLASLRLRSRGWSPRSDPMGTRKKLPLDLRHISRCCRWYSPIYPFYSPPVLDSACLRRPFGSASLGDSKQMSCRSRSSKPSGHARPPPYPPFSSHQKMPLSSNANVCCCCGRGTTRRHALGCHQKLSLGPSPSLFPTRATRLQLSGLKENNFKDCIRSYHST